MVQRAILTLILVLFSWTASAHICGSILDLPESPTSKFVQILKQLTIEERRLSKQVFEAILESKSPVNPIEQNHILNLSPEEVFAFQKAFSNLIASGLDWKEVHSEVERLSHVSEDEKKLRAEARDSTAWLATPLIRGEAFPELGRMRVFSNNKGQRYLSSTSSTKVLLLRPGSEAPVEISSHGVGNSEYEAGIHQLRDGRVVIAVEEKEAMRLLDANTGKEIVSYAISDYPQIRGEESKRWLRAIEPIENKDGSYSFLRIYENKDQLNPLGACSAEIYSASRNSSLVSKYCLCDLHQNKFQRFFAERTYSHEGLGWKVRLKVFGVGSGVEASPTVEYSTHTQPGEIVRDVFVSSGGKVYWSLRDRTKLVVRTSEETIYEAEHSELKKIGSLLDSYTKPSPFTELRDGTVLFSYNYLDAEGKLFFRVVNLETSLPLARDIEFEHKDSVRALLERSDGKLAVYSESRRGNDEYQRVLIDLETQRRVYGWDTSRNATRLGRSYLVYYGPDDRLEALILSGLSLLRVQLYGPVQR